MGRPEGVAHGFYVLWVLETNVTIAFFHFMRLSLFQDSVAGKDFVELTLIERSRK